MLLILLGFPPSSSKWTRSCHGYWGIIQVAKSSITSSNSTPPFRWPLGCIWHHETNCDGEILSPPGFHTPHSNGVLSTSLVTSFSASCCFSGGMEGWYPQWLSGVQLCILMDCTSSGSSVHGILQARILEGVAIPTPGDLPDPGIEPMSLVSPASPLTHS